MALKNTDKLFKSSFTEDDVYLFSKDNEEAESKTEDILNSSDSSDPLWYLHPSDEDNRFMTLGDFIPRNWRPPSSSGEGNPAQDAA